MLATKEPVLPRNPHNGAGQGRETSHDAGHDTRQPAREFLERLVGGAEQEYAGAHPAGLDQKI
ncbi:MAG TPA: hypothetical protein VF940_03915 [Streptosporangiaceae bacterium]